MSMLGNLISNNLADAKGMIGLRKVSDRSTSQTLTLIYINWCYSEPHVFEDIQNIDKNVKHLKDELL